MRVRTLIDLIRGVLEPTKPLKDWQEAAARLCADPELQDAAVQVDCSTGTLLISEQSLRYALSSTDLPQAGSDVLARIVPRYLDRYLAVVCSSAPDCEQLKGIEVSGHTDATGNVLTGGSAAVLARMQADLLVSRANNFPTEIQSGFAQRYLVELKARQHWNGLVCRWIRRQFGVPANGESQTPFWRRVPAPVRDEFRRWVQEQTLSEFFSAHGDTAGRFQFWRRFSSRWHDVYAAVDNRVMVMDFDEFGVIEFAEVGNAAYVYDAQSFSYILSRDPRSIAEFKNRSLVHERILHFEGWQYRADAILLPLLRRRRAAP